VLDVGLWRFNGDPEFGVTDIDRNAAIRRCARAIRDDATGVGKHAQHSLLSPTSYDFRNRLCRHWAIKAYLHDLGHDPNQFVLEVDACLDQCDRWRLKGGFLDWSKESRLFEAGFRLALVELQAALQAGADREKSVASFWQSMGTVSAGLKRTRAIEETWALVDARLSTALGTTALGTTALGTIDIQATYRRLHAGAWQSTSASSPPPTRPRVGAAFRT